MLISWLRGPAGDLLGHARDFSEAVTPMSIRKRFRHDECWALAIMLAALLLIVWFALSPKHRTSQSSGRSHRHRSAPFTYT